MYSCGRKYAERPQNSLYASRFRRRDEKLKAVGFERIDDKKQQLITQTKSFIINKYIKIKWSENQ
jgi:hypothetical protein